MKTTEIHSTFPLVDLKDQYPENCLYNALHSRGYAILDNYDPTLQELLGDITKKWIPFFSSKNKYVYLRTDSSDEGYIPINYETASKDEVADFKELYQTHYTGQYPSEVNTESTIQLFKKMISLNEEICQMIDIMLPVEVKKRMQSSLIKMVKNSNNHLIRIIHYPPIDKNIKTPRSAAHTDICLFTTVFGSMFNGLEFQNHDREWFKPEISSSGIVIFNSEMIEIATNGHLKAMMHRVKSDASLSTESRISIPIGFHPLRKMLLRDNLTAGEYIKRRLNEMGYNGDLLNLKDY